MILASAAGAAGYFLVLAALAAVVVYGPRRDDR